MVYFQTKNTNLGKEGLKLEIVDRFYGHLEYFIDIRDVL
jgi:hypothetical protein